MNGEALYIVGAKRTPIGAFMGSLSGIPPQQLAATAAKSAMDQAGIPPSDVEQVIMGCVLTAGLGMAPARQVAIMSGCGENTPAVTINKVCASGLQSVILAADAIRSGSAQIVVAGGMESMSRAPHFLPGARRGYRYGDGKIVDHMQFDGLRDAYDAKSMGEHAQATADKEGLTRFDLDAFATASLTRARAAANNGGFSEEIVPVSVKDKKGEQVLNRDELPDKLDPGKILNLEPSFRDGGTITPASSSAIADGAAILVLASKTAVRRRNLKPLAKVLSAATHACAPAEFTKAPIPAIASALKSAQFKRNPAPLFEINEAFATVPVMAIRALGLNQDDVNIHGGACALGHPIGCSGARILATLIYAMRKKNVAEGVGAVCVGGGEGVALSVSLP